MAHMESGCTNVPLLSGVTGHSGGVVGVLMTEFQSWWQGRDSCLGSELRNWGGGKVWELAAVSKEQGDAQSDHWGLRMTVLEFIKISITFFINI